MQSANNMDMNTKDPTPGANTRSRSAMDRNTNRDGSTPSTDHRSTNNNSLLSMMNGRKDSNN